MHIQEALLEVRTTKLDYIPGIVKNITLEIFLYKFSGENRVLLLNFILHTFLSEFAILSQQTKYFKILSYFHLQIYFMIYELLNINWKINMSYYLLLPCIWQSSIKKGQFVLHILNLRENGNLIHTGKYTTYSVHSFKLVWLHQ